MRTPIKEPAVVDAPPTLDPGGYIEDHAGQPCLRLGDEVVALKCGRFRVTRTWVPPGGYIPEYYEVKNS